MRHFPQLRLLWIAFFTALLLLGCGGPKEDAVVKDYLTSIASGNIDKAMLMIHIETDDASEKAAIEGKIKAMLIEMKAKQLDPKGGIKSIEISNKEFSEDKKNIIVSYNLTYNDKSRQNGVGSS